ncbi:hypothetical protein SAY86_022111 [Trapa natans]|uniref:Remorin C-terminal domain-containing protein n=1 Tax=Trapa natans TaxID=22666 RepID=A0AAN7M9U7_TRANT|nr:hypothetical protein SAY86_022111 [Trapa natans]
MMEEEVKNSESFETLRGENPKGDTINKIYINDGADDGEESIIPDDEEKKKKEKVSSAPKAASANPIEKHSESSDNRDVVLARLETEKWLALIKAWEESEKSKAENKAFKRLSAVEAWENSEKAAVEAKLKKKEEKMERKKAEYAERMKNMMTDVHKAAEQKRAMVEAKRGEDIVKVEEKAGKFLAKGYTPKRLMEWISF